MNKLFQSTLAEMGLSLDQAQIEQFAHFEKALYEANEVMNLTRIEQSESWLRHFVDSLLFVDKIQPESTVLDLGTGPGFPAWPIACARQDLSVTAVDSSGKMLGFLKSQPLENLRLIQVRAEEWGIREKFDVVTGRAVAPLPLQLELSASAAKIGGFLIPMRTIHEEFELESLGLLGLELEEVLHRELPGTDIVRAFPIYRKVSRTDRSLPRRWAEMKKAPLR